MLVSAPRSFPGRIGFAFSLVGSAVLAFASVTATAEARPAQEVAAGEGSIPPVVDEYIIGPGDALQLFVWKEPDLTTALTVRMDGKTTVPLLGDVVAAGRTAHALAVDVTEKLEKYLAEPQVTISVTQASAARFFVVGQVNRPGEYPLRGRTSLVQALATAGGFREFAKEGELVIVRQAEGGDVFLRASYDDLKSGKDPSQNLVLKAGDTILVP
jgi:polysaccharide export outer membrane protein